MSLRSSWVLGALAVGLAALGSGCASERDPINQVQANALHKSFFVGDDLASAEDDPEFYSATTVVDVPYGADQGSVFTGLVGGLMRIKWEITETTLNARLTYEHIEGVDGHGSKSTNDGQVIGSWRIESHFDIRHAYNPSTGEELNLIEENSSDRPWYERAYFRVNWGTNLVAQALSWDPLALDDFETEQLEYYVNDPAHPDAPVFDVADGYFDITNRMYLTPRTLTISGNELPACYFRGSFVIGATYPWGTCDPVEITVRHSFRRVAQPGEPGYTDYEVREWDGSRMDAFGAFVQERLGWDRNYGIVDDEWHRFIQRYNIWKKSHLDLECGTPETTPPGCDPDRDGDLDCDGKYEPEQGEFADGTADECAPQSDRPGGRWGSRCDRFVGKCTIPYASRELKPVAWHYTINAEDEVIYDSTEFATWEWDAALRIAVQAGRYAECVSTYTGSLVGSPYAEHAKQVTDFNEIRSVCGQLFPIDNSHDDAEKNAVRDVNICIRQGGDRASCLEQARADSASYPNHFDPLAGEYVAVPLDRTVAAMDPLIVLCHSPVADGDAAACGPRGTVARPGDIRFHQVNVWPTRQSISPWGYGPSLADPLTGEIISAGINVYNAVTDASAQSFLDQIRWIMGELSAADITTGKNVHDWVQAGQYSASQMGPLLPRDEIDRRLAGMTGVDLEDIAQGDAIRRNMDPSLMKKAVREIEASVVPPGVMPEDRAVFDERIKKGQETGVEAELMNPMWLQMAGVPPDLAHEDQLELASPLRGMGARNVIEGYDKTQRMLAQKGQCVMAAPEPTGLPALAKIMAEKFPPLDPSDFVDEGGNPDGGKFQKANAERIARMWDYLRWKMNFTVILHEMGHTVGLRHNFVSSYDKYSYKPQYWQLRTDSGRVKGRCNGPVSDGSECVDHRYYDPLTQEEIDNSIWTWQQTSVMDYAGDVTQDMLGLGIYDMAAARAFYADVIDVRDDGQTAGEDCGAGGTEIGNAVCDLVDYPGYVLGQWVFDDGDMPVQYPQYNEFFELVQPERCYPVETAAPSWWDEGRMGAWSPVFDGFVVKGERCSRNRVDYVPWEGMKPDRVTVDFDDPRFFTPRRAVDYRNRPRVPYGFLSDEYADGWSPSAYRHDNGADMYEEVVFHSNLYENRHIFDNFRNGRSNFTIYGAYQRALSRYHYKVANLVQGFAYSLDFIFKEFAKNTGFPFDSVIAAYAGPGGPMEDHAVAAAAGFDHFVRVLTRPHAGAHYQDFSAGTLLPIQDVIGFSGQVAATIPNGNMLAGNAVTYAGRPINNGFQYSHGYWTWNYLDQAGSYYEKTYAFERMLEATYGAINFYRFDGLDARFRHINFSNLYTDGIRQLIGATLTEDADLLGARITKNGNGGPHVELADDGGLYPIDPLAWVSYVPGDGPIACAPTDGVLACTDSMGSPLGNGATADALVVDPQLGYEVQKFIVFWSYVYQPGREVLDWIEQMRIYKTGEDVDPDYLPASYLEWRDPISNLRYIARRYGDETLFGKTYDKGIAAKMIQWANILTAEAYELDPVEPYDPVTGRANVALDGSGNPILKGVQECDLNKACTRLRNYRGLLDYTRDTAARLGFPEPALQVFTPD